MIEEFAHEGVGLLIRSEDASLWFVQQKDETYPIEKWRLSYSVWGGAMEEDEKPATALLRELKEELNWQPEKMPRFLGRFLVESDAQFPIHLFELEMPREELEHWAANLSVAEGYGQLVEGRELFDRSWVWDLDQLLRKQYGSLLY